MISKIFRNKIWEIINYDFFLSATGGTIWSRAQPGPVTNYAKNVVNRNDNGDSLLNKLTSRQVKLQILKDDYIQKQHEKLSSVANNKEKKTKCGQCEKNLAFTVLNQIL